MTLLIAGLLLWSFVHLFKRVAPDARAGMNAKFGERPSKGIIALLLLASILLMIFGFRHEGPSYVYSLPGWTLHLNNLLMLIAIYLMGAGSGKGISPTLLRHPMLAGVLVWSVSHLIVNGDMRSIVLFGGLGVWSIAEMLVINKQEGAWDRPVAGPIKADIKTVVISLVVFGVIATIHYLLGRSPFGG